MDGPVPARALWGKLERRGDEVLSWHPWIDHCIDVARVTEALLRRTLIGTRLATLARRSSFDEVTIQRLAVVAGLHDIGKANHGFQARGHNPQSPRVGHVAEGLNLFVGDAGKRVRGLLCKTGLSTWFHDPKSPTTLRAAIAHHGMYPDATAAQAIHWRTTPYDPFDAIEQLIHTLLETFPRATEHGPPLPPEDTEDAPDLSFVHGWAGLVMLADWLGSDRSAFPYSEPGEDRRATSEERARRVLRATGIETPPRPPEPASFDDVTLDGRPARPAQSVLFDVPIPEGPSIFVLEAETGSGKTEAAFAHFARLYAKGLVDGLYFALPTRAAASQLHERIRALTRRWHPSDPPGVFLTVPGLMRVDDATARPGLAPFEYLWNDDRELADRHRYWAAENTKRFLAAPIAVGTIDQVLLSSLRVPHTHLRATALTRSLLVVDEVHASDAYMTRILQEVLAHHREAGGHALLLSATLEVAEREKLLSAHPRRTKRTAFADACSDPFPRVGAPEGRFWTIPGATVHKVVHLREAPILTDAAAIAERAADAARAGARVLVLRNTVSGCVAVMEELLRRDPGMAMQCRGTPAPHHSRFAPEDRALLNHAVEAAFAPRGPHQGGVVCVATQTVEQSLDIDADHLITDLCPVDVLLQRIGRLHRHARADRPEAFHEPRCEVLVPPAPLASLVGPGDQVKCQHGLGSVYKNLVVLEACRRLVTTRPTWTIPADNRYLVEAGLHQERVDALAAELGIPHHLKTVRAHEAVKSSNARSAAWQMSESIDQVGIGREENIVATRWSEEEDEDRIIQLPDGGGVSPFGAQLRSLRVPGFLLRGVALEAPVVFDRGADALTVRVDDATITYTAMGIQRV